MEFKIRNLHDASCKNIRSLGRYKKWDKYYTRNQILMETAYNKLVNEEIDYIVLDDEKQFAVLHRSPRDGVVVQFSHGWIKNGKLIPTYHEDINSFNELSKEGFSSGIWRAEKNAI